MNKKFLYIFLPLILSIFVVIGIVLGSVLENSSTKQSLFFPVNKKFNNSNKLNEILNFIEDAYVDTVNKQKLIESSIEEILKKLDPHSYYIPAKEFVSMNEPLEGNFDGIGVEFRIKEDTVFVVNPIVGGPSEKLGILAGDRIVKVEDSLIAGVNIQNNQVIKLLKGPRGTKVNIEVIRKGAKKPLKFTITRDKIPIYSIDAAYLIDEYTGYIKISRFAKTTYDEFYEAALQLKLEGAERFIIDLRGNGGGVLSAATQIVDEFLPKNKMIVYTDGKSRTKQEIYSTNKGVLKTAKIAVIINEGSASASEIVAGAIQDNDRGLILGRRSFGKGLVQEQVVWPDGSGLRLTVARYYTPTGRCIQKSYSEGVEAYHLEAYERLEKGELQSKDSIQFPDSLKYYTPEGKVVYGGGGIMPDIFIPLDTTYGSEFLYQLRYQAVMQEYALYYVDNNREFLNDKYNNMLTFQKEFKLTNQMLNDLVRLAESKGIERNLDDIIKSKQSILRETKAAIAVQLYNNMGFYLVINQTDKTVQRALKELAK